MNETTEAKLKLNKEKRIYSRVFALVAVFLFMFALAILGVISAVDVDKTVSDSENRTLATMPEFSWSALLDGSFMKDFEAYYSDTFPLRDMFMQLNTKITSVLTQFGGKEDTVLITYEKHDSDFVGEGVDLGVEGEQAPSQNHHASEDEVAVKGAILLSGTRAMEVFTNSSAITDSYSALVNKTAQSMPAGVQFYSMIVPTSVEFYGTETYTSGAHSQKTAINDAYSKMDNSIIKIDVYPYLEKTADQYIYFRTDHHWTARGAYQGYLAFCDKTKQTPVALDALETGKIENFVGSLYSASNADVLKENPDYVEYFKTRVDVTGTVYPDSSLTNGQPFYIVARAVNSDNKYLAFIGGDQPLEKIVTSNKNGKKILVIKESYGNALVPFLCDNYEEVYVVDPRKTNFNLPEFVEQQGIGEVLMINYSFAMSNKTFSDAMYSMLG
ncbi:MAG: hypothetical protein E7536_01705 [Ruminococcaceae bacterium]|nr:hypothetical protein [Oscillospiraceae bacterium]